MKKVVFLNGEYNYSNDFIKTITNKAFVLCADGGANACFSYGVNINEVVGDLDSINDEVLDYLKYNYVNIKKYPVDKDYSDFELILNEIKLDDEVIILGAFGGRVDYSINNFMLLEGHENIKIITNNEEVYYKDKSFTINNCIGKRVSFVSLDSKIENMTLEGFKYDLKNVTVKRNVSMLMSNEVKSDVAKVLFDEGKILVFVELI